MTVTTPYYERALNQKVYPGVGDIDDCWVVATIWAIRRETRQTTHLPNCKVYRAAAGDPDDGRKDGGTLDEIAQGASRLYPHINFIKYAKPNGWAGLVALLDKGYTVSIATKSSYLPRAYRFGFLGTHQIAAFKRDGKFYIMNPLQPQGSAPMRISEASLKSAVYHFANGWVMGLVVPNINLGKFVMKASKPTLYKRWSRRPNGTWTYSVRTTLKGWSATACPPETFTAGGKRRKLAFISTGGNAGYYVEVTGVNRTFTP